MAEISNTSESEALFSVSYELRRKKCLSMEQCLYEKQKDCFVCEVQFKVEETVEHPTVNLRKHDIRFIGTGLLKQVTTTQTTHQFVINTVSRLTLSSTR